MPPSSRSLRTGSGGSDVVNDDCRHLIDSGDSCLPAADGEVCLGMYGELNSEEEDGSEGGGSYFSDVFRGAEPMDLFILP